MIPESNVCLQIDSYQIETLQIKDNIIKTLSLRLAPSAAAAIAEDGSSEPDN